MYDQRRLAPSAARPPAARVFGLGFDATTVPQIESDVPSNFFVDTSRLAPFASPASPAALQSTTQGGAASAPVGSPPPPAPTPGTYPTTTTSYGQPPRYQGSPLIQQDVSVPPSWAGFAAATYTVAPPKPTDLGPMVPPGVASRMDRRLPGRGRKGPAPRARA